MYVQASDLSTRYRHPVVNYHQRPGKIIYLLHLHHKFMYEVSFVLFLYYMILHVIIFGYVIQLQI